MKTFIPISSRKILCMQHKFWKLIYFWVKIFGCQCRYIFLLLIRYSHNFMKSEFKLIACGDDSRSWRKDVKFEHFWCILEVIFFLSFFLLPKYFHSNSSKFRQMVNQSLYFLSEIPTFSRAPAARDSIFLLNIKQW